jgi:hypothetical protein
MFARASIYALAYAQKMFKTIKRMLDSVVWRENSLDVSKPMRIRTILLPNVETSKYQASVVYHDQKKGLQKTYQEWCMGLFFAVVGFLHSQILSCRLALYKKCAKKRIPNIEEHTFSMDQNECDTLYLIHDYFSQGRKIGVVEKIYLPPAMDIDDKETILVNHFTEIDDYVCDITTNSKNKAESFMAFLYPHDLDISDFIQRYVLSFVSPYIPQIPLEYESDSPGYARQETMMTPPHSRKLNVFDLTYVIFAAGYMGSHMFRKNGIPSKTQIMILSLDSLNEYHFRGSQVVDFRKSQ